MGSGIERHGVEGFDASCVPLSNYAYLLASFGIETRFRFTSGETLRSYLGRECDVEDLPDFEPLPSPKVAFRVR